MKTLVRIPGTVEYSFAELHTTEGSVPDNFRELRDVDATFVAEVMRVLQDGCTFANLAQLKPQVIEQPQQPVYQQPVESPQWLATPTQEAQGYSPPQQGYNPPQNAPQAPQQAYQQPQYAPQQQSGPPGMVPPPNPCNRHGQMAKYKPAGNNKTTGRPYNAFWTCAAGDFECTKESGWPKL